MLTINHRITWGHKPCLVGEIRDNNSRLNNDEPEVGSGPNIEEIYINCSNASIWYIIPCFHALLFPIDRGSTGHCAKIAWFIHDDAPAYFSIVLLNRFHATYLGRWIGHREPVTGSPRFNYHRPLNFFFLAHMKSILYEMPVATEYITSRIFVASSNIVSTLNLIESSYNPSAVDVGYGT
ncbi:hypothetical protein TNCV_949491 [Trichonephila clavipes]|nr:hypothetical protein TNCV_949491 [Trichonephila clavipes]